MSKSRRHEVQRDSSSLRVLAVFFAILGATVTGATYWALDQPRAALVNAISGLVLFGIGVGAWVVAGRMQAQACHASGDAERPTRSST